MGEIVHIENWDDLSLEELDVLERKIAGQFMGLVPWGAVAWGLCNCAVFISLFPLVLMGIVPLWLAFPIATLNVTLSYLPSHEAQHNIIAGKGKPLRWVNELVGHVSTIPLVQPYRVLRATHMEHHKYTNDTEKDCDIDIHARSNLEFIWKMIQNRQPESNRSSAYGRSLERTGQQHLIIDAIVMQSAYLVVIFSMAWTGYAIEAFFLWWLPKFLAEFHITYYLAWKPHQPGVKQGRYRDTRAFKSRLGNVVSAGMQYHIIHHLYPRIPLSLTPAAYRELRPILERRGCDLGELQN
ncbi:MAG TPA: beta-carotene hydroxylase [Gammaproteobacteria bacterium]|nr:beta-carotene hydroxylase [Gammaproteobacteria bacterium]